MKGKFIVIEGIDNCGKTTQTSLLKKYFEDKKIKVINTREPGGTKVGEEIREILLKAREKIMDPVTQALLFYAARKEFLNEVVRPSIDKGIVVITDRFAASTYVYQGYVQGVDKKFIDLLQQEIVTDCLVDIYIILDITARESLKRGGNADRAGQDLIYEKQGVQFIEKLREGYRKYAEENENVILINGMKNAEEMHLEIIKVLKRKGIL